LRPDGVLVQTVHPETKGDAKELNHSPGYADESSAFFEVYLPIPSSFRIICSKPYLVIKKLRATWHDRLFKL
jgi:hypothetical protein